MNLFWLEEAGIADDCSKKVDPEVATEDRLAAEPVEGELWLIPLEGTIATVVLLVRKLEFAKASVLDVDVNILELETLPKILLAEKILELDLERELGLNFSASEVIISLKTVVALELETKLALVAEEL